METSTITIKRTNQYANKFREIKVFLDDRLLFELSNNETKSAEVPAGKHRLSARVDWGRAEPLNILIEKDKTASFELGSPIVFKKGYSRDSIIRSVILIGGSVVGRIMDNSWITWFALLFPLLWLIRDSFFTKEKSVLYYITFGRKKYLYLKEV